MTLRLAIAIPYVPHAEFVPITLTYKARRFIWIFSDFLNSWFLGSALLADHADRYSQSPLTGSQAAFLQGTFPTSHLKWLKAQPKTGDGENTFFFEAWNYSSYSGTLFSSPSDIHLIFATHGKTAVAVLAEGNANEWVARFYVYTRIQFSWLRLGPN